MKASVFLWIVSLTISTAFAEKSKVDDYSDVFNPAKNSNQYHCKILRNIEYKALNERFYLNLSLEESYQDTMIKMNQYYDTTEYSEEHTQEFRKQISDIAYLITAAVFKRPHPKLMNDSETVPEKFEAVAYQICMENLAAQPF